MPKFVVYNYPPVDGEGSVPRNEAWFPNAWSAFNEAARRVGDLDEWRRGVAYELEGSGLMPIMALRESKEPDCGGVQISCTLDDPAMTLVDTAAPASEGEAGGTGSPSCPWPPSP